MLLSWLLSFGIYICLSVCLSVQGVDSVHVLVSLLWLLSFGIYMCFSALVYTQQQHACSLPVHVLVSLLWLHSFGIYMCLSALVYTQQQHACSSHATRPCSFSPNKAAGVDRFDGSSMHYAYHFVHGNLLPTKLD
jgi:hypothetical protein